MGLKPTIFEHGVALFVGLEYLVLSATWNRDNVNVVIVFIVEQEIFISTDGCN